MKIIKKIRGRPVGHTYLIDEKEMTSVQALEYLKNAGFSQEDSVAYIANLKTDEELIGKA